MEMIILRAASSTARAKVYRGRRPVSTADAEAGAVILETADVTPKDELDLREDPTVYGAAPPMPIRLVEPLTSASASATAPPIPEVSWGVRAVGAAESAFDGAGVTVAVLDTGIDPAYATHQAFAGLSVESKNFTTSPDGDTHGHGTHCAGTIFGRTVDGCRIGVAPGVSKALIGKVIGAGGGSTESICKGILWAYENGAHVISMSIGMDFTAYRERLARSWPPQIATSMALAGYLSNVRLFDRLSQVTTGRDTGLPGSIVIAAAGNESQRDIKPDYRVTVAPPAAADLFLSVAALGRTTEGAAHPYQIAEFSNTGARIAAPGVDILSAKLGGGLTEMSGTSMATPHVAGVAALWVQRSMKRRRFQAPAVIEDLKRAVVELDYLDADDVGLGLVRAPVEGAANAAR